VGSILRIIGGGLFLAMMTLPALEGCGQTRTQVELAEKSKHPATPYVVAGAVAIGVFAILSAFTRKVNLAVEALVIAGAAAALGAIGWFILEAQRFKVNILWTVGVQLLGAALMLVGAIDRIRSRRKERS
jgi:hypothetical protein